MRCDDQRGNSKKRGRQETGRKESHIVLISNDSSCTPHATRYRLGNDGVPLLSGQYAVQSILYGFEEGHGDARRKERRNRRVWLVCRADNKYVRVGYARQHKQTECAVDVKIVGDV